MLKDVIKFVWQYKWIIRNFPQTIYFNFRYLPFKQAFYLPILLYKPTILKSCGKIKINGPVKFGMIKLGPFQIGIYPNTGIVLQNNGLIVFEGKANIGNDSAISVGASGILTFGRSFAATCGLKITCYYRTTFENDVIVGWNTLFSDTDFHALTKVNGGY